MKTKIKVKIFLALLLSLMVCFDGAQAASKNIGQSCQHGSDCRSGFCGGDFTCEGTVPAGGDCSFSDQTKSCQSGLYCQGDTFKCEADTRSTNNPNTTAIMKQQNSSSNTSSGATYTGSTRFTNPVAFNSVEDFLSNGLLVTLQRLIVVIAVIMIIIGAYQYITAGVAGSAEAGKKTITAALIGFTIAIAAPSLLKEIGGIIGWSGTSTMAAPSLTQILTNVLNFLLGTMGILSLIMLVYGGIMYLTSAGDSKNAETGKNIFKYSLMGVGIAMISMVLVTQIARIITGGQ